MTHLLLLLGVGSLLLVPPCVGAAEPDRVVYKCPGNLYNDQLTPAEAIAQGCKTLEGAPVRPVPPSGAARAENHDASEEPGRNWRRLLREDSCANYWEPSTKAVAGQYVKAWFMKSCATPNNQTAWKSAKTLYYFQCASKTYMAAQEVLYEDQNGGGRVMRSLSSKVRPDAFREVVPDSVGHLWLTVACGR